MTPSCMVSAMPRVFFTPMRRGGMSSIHARNSDGRLMGSAHEIKLVDIEKAAIGHLEMGNDREGEEGDLEERLGEHAIERLGGVAKVMEVMGHFLEGFLAHQAGDRESKLRRDRAIVRDNEAAPELDQSIDGDG